MENGGTFFKELPASKESLYYEMKYRDPNGVIFDISHNGWVGAKKWATRCDDRAARFEISPQLIDDTLNDAYGQRQITQYFTQLNTYFIILEILPELQVSLVSLERLYVKISPVQRHRTPFCVGRCDTTRAGSLSVSIKGGFPRSLWPSIFGGDAQAFQASLSSWW
jgi:hypothetical protein